MNKRAATFRNESGAFDLPSIMIGVAVVAILTVGVLAAIFGVIPWSQDKAAQQDLGAVHNAQGAAFAKDGGFMDAEGLVDGNWLASPPDRLDIRTSDDGDGKCYVAVNASQTGRKFVVSSDNPTPRELSLDDEWCGGQIITSDNTDGEEVPFVSEVVRTESATTYTCGPHSYTISDADRDQGMANYNHIIGGGGLDGVVHIGDDGWDLLLADSESFMTYSSESMMQDNTGGPHTLGVHGDGSCAARYGSRLGGISREGFNEAGLSYGLYQPKGIQTLFEWVNEKGELHQNGAPSVLVLTRDGKVAISESWHENGELHRIGGPSEILRAVDGSLEKEEWRENGELHRLDGPALRWTPDEGVTYIEKSYINGSPIDTYQDWVAAGGVPGAWIE